MEIKLNIGGTDVSITVGTPQEAMALLGLFAAQDPTSKLQAPSKFPEPTVLPQHPLDLLSQACNPGDVLDLENLDTRVVPLEPDLDHEMGASDSQVLNALRRMQGNPSAKVLKAIVDSGAGIFDVKIREAAGISAEAGLGPIFSHISKCCLSEGITRDALLIRRSKRGRKGKVHFHYRATDQASRLVKSIPDFATSQDSPELGDLDMLDL